MTETKPFAGKEILVAEYEYIAQTAFQAQEDRARVTSFYIVSLGSLFGAFIGTNFSERTVTWLTYAAFAGLFFFLSYFGLVTIKHLALLRKAWFESARAMNQIKDFVISKDKELSKAFRWQSETLPKQYKPESVGFLLAHQVASLSGITLGAAIYYAGKAAEEFLPSCPILLISIAVLVGFLFLTYQMRTYRKELEA